jgi:hypothetical protein
LRLSRRRKRFVLFGAEARRCGVFAALEFWDIFWIVMLISIFAGGSTAYSLRRPTESPIELTRLRRVEAKLDLILQHLGLEYKERSTPGGLSEEVRALADNPSQKIAAIALHRKETGLGLKEAKEAVEAYMEGRRG